MRRLAELRVECWQVRSVLDDLMTGMEVSFLGLEGLYRVIRWGGDPPRRSVVEFMPVSRSQALASSSPIRINHA